MWKYVQGFVGVVPDGVPGVRTVAAVAVRLGVAADWVAVQRRVGVAADGVPGVMTAEAVAAALGVRVPKVWPSQAEVRSCKSVFGKYGSELVVVELPYPMRLAWDRGAVVCRMSCHALVAEALVRIFRRSLEHYGIERIRELGLDLFGGCFNDREIVGGKSKSMHAWGIAVDMDPDSNGMSVHRPRARLSGGEYEAFWSFVEDEGAVSLGREKDYDWMHFQFAGL